MLPLFLGASLLVGVSVARSLGSLGVPLGPCAAHGGARALGNACVLAQRIHALRGFAAGGVSVNHPRAFVATGALPVVRSVGRHVWFWLAAIWVGVGLAAGLRSHWRPPAALGSWVARGHVAAALGGCLIEVVRRRWLASDSLNLVAVASVVGIVAGFEASRALALAGCGLVVLGGPLAMLAVVMPPWHGWVLGPRSLAEAVSGALLLCLGLAMRRGYLSAPRLARTRMSRRGANSLPVRAS